MSQEVIPRYAAAWTALHTISLRVHVSSHKPQNHLEQCKLIAETEINENLLRDDKCLWMVNQITTTLSEKVVLGPAEMTLMNARSLAQCHDFQITDFFRHVTASRASGFLCILPVR